MKVFLFLMITVFAFRIYAETPITVFDSGGEAEVKKTYIDKDGDKVTILDIEARKKIEESKGIKASHVYDNEEDLNKYKQDYEKDVLSSKDVTYGSYVVIEGDSLKKIAQKIYGNTQKWKEIQVLNEAKLKNTTINKGMTLKYIIYKKEVQNGRSTGQNGNN